MEEEKMRIEEDMGGEKKPGWAMMFGFYFPFRLIYGYVETDNDEIENPPCIPRTQVPLHSTPHTIHRKCIQLVMLDGWSKRDGRLRERNTMLGGV